MEAVKDLLQRAVGLHGRLAAAVGPSRLTCGTCGRIERPSQEQLAEYFRRGWPACCGRTMTLERSS